MKTIDYPWYNPPFSEYNQSQSAVVPFLDKDVNLVVSFATATGKTVLAEGAFAYHLATDDKSRMAYICPFKSLALEKYDAWIKEPQLSLHGVVLGTSDGTATHEDFLMSRLAILTAESFDSKCRSPKWQEWIKSLSCVTIDEAHLIGDEDRGGAMEAAIMNLTQLCPSARLVLLSATMGCPDSIARWVKSLNGKVTKCISSEWRPTKVDLKVFTVSDYKGRIEEAVRLAEANSHKKTIVFVHSKIVGAEIVKSLRKIGVKAAFHNASVPKGKRRKIEELFNKSSLNVLVSTSTLSAGMNMG